MLQEQLLDGGTDVAVLYGLEIGGALRSELLWSMPPYVVLPATHRLADLAGEPMIMLDAPPSKVHMLTALAGVGIAPTIGRVTRNFETLRSLVGRGYGWGLLVQHPAVDRSYEGMPIRSVAIADPIEPAPVVAATVAGSASPHRTLACIELLRGLAPPQPRSGGL